MLLCCRIFLKFSRHSPFVIISTIEEEINTERGAKCWGRSGVSVGGWKHSSFQSLFSSSLCKA